MPSAKPSLTVRLPMDVKEQLEEMAKSNRRSVSNQLSVLLEGLFAQQDEKRGSITPDTNQKPASTSINKEENRTCP